MVDGAVLAVTGGDALAAEFGADLNLLTLVYLVFGVVQGQQIDNMLHVDASAGLVVLVGQVEVILFFCKFTKN